MIHIQCPGVYRSWAESIIRAVKIKQNTKGANVSIEVIGAGFGRTGTLSLKYALEHLGYNKCYHMLEVRNHPDHTDLWRTAHLGQPGDWQALYEG